MHESDQTPRNRPIRLAGVRLAGWLYNIGNIPLILTPLLLSHNPELADKFLHNPLPVLAGFGFFISAIYYGRGDYVTGNRGGVISALMLGVDCGLRGEYVAAACVILLQAGGKTVGSFPHFFVRMFGESRWGILRATLGHPGAASGFGPMLSRVPVAIDVVRSGNWLLGLSCLLWLAADYCLTRVRRESFHAKR